MALYAIAFDMNTVAMRDDGLTGSDITRVYQEEIPTALAACGFTAHPQGSVYHTESDQDPIRALMQLQGTVQRLAPQFCHYVRSVHVFRMEEWSDVTELLANRPSLGPPNGEQEMREQDERDGNGIY